ncbi:MAG: hypothetical protein O7C62_04830, partial [Rickettsia endosymbiont of Ixodes persulcatus]|nr:hypothetical protein [Rickettsia endosymbiont of Ixodes persulcatus]
FLLYLIKLHKLFCIIFLSQIGNIHKKTIPRPDYWVGVVVVPVLMEFWQEGLDRIHIRYQYTRDNSMCKWNVVELYP